MAQLLQENANTQNNECAAISMTTFVSVVQKTATQRHLHNQ